MARGRKTGGRQKGTPNKLSADIEEKLRALGCDPIAGMARIALGFDENGERIPGVTVDLQARMHAELAQYIAPKRKAVEHSGPDGGSVVVAWQPPPAA